MDSFLTSLAANVAIAPVLLGTSAVLKVSTGKNLQQHISNLKRKATSHIEQALKTHPVPPATNHDLQRALCLAYHGVGVSWLADMKSMARNSPASELAPDTEETILSFVAAARKALYKAERLAYERGQEFAGLVGESVIAPLLNAVPETNYGDSELTQLNSQLISGFSTWLQSPQTALAPFPQALNSRLQASDFGIEVLRLFTEILKGGSYPEATKAFEFSAMGAIRSDIKQLAENTKGMSDVADAMKEALHQFDAFYEQLAQINDKLDEIADIVDENNALLTILCALPLDRGLAPGADEQANTFVKMSYVQRSTLYCGRANERQQLLNFLHRPHRVDNNERLFCWWQLAGQAGQGKSRLALELVRGLGPAWDAGFLSSAALAKADFNRVVFKKPTLIVIDYAAAPQKAAQVSQAILTLANRADGNQQPALGHPVRLLVLERGGYSFLTDAEKPAFNWLQGALARAANYTFYKAYAFAETPLALPDPTDNELMSIARSWRDSLKLPLLSDTQEQQLQRLLNRSSPASKERRARNPLFAMLYGQFIDQDRSGSAPADDLATILERALADERASWWKDDNGEDIEPCALAHNLACLATLAGGINEGDLLKQLNPQKDQGEEQRLADFYGSRNKPERRQACYLLGFSPKEYNRLGARQLPAREPDLLGEILLLWSLADDDIAAELGLSPQQRASQLIQHAALQNTEGTLAALIRLGEDFKDHKQSQLLRGVPLSNSDISIFATSYYGLAGILAAQLSSGADAKQTDSKTGIFPLLLAAENGHSDCVKLLLEKSAQVDQIRQENGSFPLLMAAQNGHSDCVELLLDQGAEVNQIDPQKGAFPLIMAAHQGHSDCVRLLLEHGAEVNKTDSQNGIFPLLLAAENGHSDCVQLLLERGAEVNQIEPKRGLFPLLMAAHNCHSDCVRLLLERGAEVNQINPQSGNFPLLQAAHNGHSETVKLLLGKGAKVNQTEPKSGAFPLLQAAENGHRDCVKLLLKYGAEVNQINPQSGTFPLLMAAQNGHNDCVQLLLAQGAEVNQVHPKDGLFPLLLAAQNGHSDCVRLLLERGAEVNQIHQQSAAFPLLMAAENGHNDCVQLLLAQGAEVNQSNPQNGTFPLLMAAQQGHSDCVQLLLKYGAEVNQINPKNGTFPLLQAAQNGHSDCVRLLLESGAEVNQSNPQNGTFPLLMAAQNGHSDCVQLLLENGADVNQINPQNGLFPLIVASYGGHSDCVQLLLNYGAEVNQTNPQNGAFPLLMAAEEGHSDCVELLLKHDGAEVNQIHQQDGTFPLLMAAQNGHSDCLRLLLAQGAKVNQTNPQNGAFPLLIAALEGHSDCVKLLLEKGADAKQTNQQSGTLPLLLAAQQGHSDCVQLLLKYGAEVNQIEPKSGAFPLLMAAQQGHSDCVQLLLEHGANIHQTIIGPALPKPKTALEVAEMVGQHECAALIREAAKNSQER